VSIQWDSSWPELAKEDDRHRLLSYLEGRFGIPENLFDDCLLFERKKSWWLLRNTPQLVAASRIKVSLVGLRAFSRVGDYVKPSTRMIQIFGNRATRARCDLREGALQTLMAGEPIPVDLPIENGYVILSLKGHILGLGLLINGLIRSQIPRKELRSF
jgi:NOL1/NOP2/fmu family ribosome biogenesis protein